MFTILRYIVVAIFASLAVSAFFTHGTSHVLIMNGEYGAMWILSLRDALHIIVGAIIFGLVSTSVSTMILFTFGATEPMVIGILTTFATIVYWAEFLS